MIASIHPFVDQLVQWMDGQICRRKKTYLKIPIDLRLYAALRISRHRLGFVRKKVLEAGIEYWDPPAGIWDPAQPGKIGRRRHFLLTDRGLTQSEPGIPKYIDSLCSKMSDAFLDKCFKEVGAMIHPIWEGHFDIVGWDEEGRMELEVSAQGAERLGSPLGERFFSGIGLIETSRVHD